MVLDDYRGLLDGKTGLDWRNLFFSGAGEEGQHEGWSLYLISMIYLGIILSKVTISSISSI